MQGGMSLSTAALFLNTTQKICEKVGGWVCVCNAGYLLKHYKLQHINNKI